MNKMTVSDDLLCPSAAYRDKLYGKHKAATQETIESLTARAGIDVEQNRKTVSEYNHECEIAKRIAGSTKKWRRFRTFLIAALVLAVLAAAALIYDKQYLWLILCAVVLAISLFVWLRFVNPTIKNKDALSAEHRQNAEQLLEQAWAQMKPLNSILDGDITRQLIEETIPQIKIDRYFDVCRLKHFEDSYGYDDSDQFADMSTIKVISGEMNGNPYIIEKYLSCTMGECKYEGTREIVWYDTVISYDSEGGLEEYEREHHETLRAYVVKPKPYFRCHTLLTYGNEAAPELSFSRKMTHVDRMPEKQQKKFVKSNVKKLRHMEKKAVKAGGEFTRMGNDEFEAIFNAADRNNELQFRLLFTPLAQENLLDLMRTPEPYGDDFNFSKIHMLNFINAEHGDCWDLNTDAKRYFSYSYDRLYQAFMDYNVDYFRRFFFMFAPILSIPLYQQYQSHEQIYGKREDFPRNYASNQAEALANAIGEEAFAPENADTDTILKTKLVAKNGDVDIVKVTAKSYQIVRRIEVVPVKAGDGNYYDVEVPWDEYIPVRRSQKMEMCALELSEPEYRERLSDQRFQAYTQRNQEQYAYANGIFACALHGDSELYNLRNL